MGEAAPDALLCENDIHCQRTKAVAHLTFPSDRFHPTTACAGCLDWSVRQARAEVYPITITPIGSQP